MGSSASLRRILALWLPRLATDRLQRRDEPDKRPLVVVAKVDNALRLTAVDRQAERMNLRVDMPLADARAMISSLRVVEADEATDQKLIERIADWCDRYTPFVALDPPHGLLLDITGVPQLFSGERALLDGVRAAIAKQGLAVKAAIA